MDDDMLADVNITWNGLHDDHDHNHRTTMPSPVHERADSKSKRQVRFILWSHLKDTSAMTALMTTRKQNKNKEDASFTALR